MLQHDGTAARPSVLYVEDRLVNVTLMRAVFARRPGLQLHVATTGREALQMAPELKPALLLLDVHLPDCHATQLLIELRRHPGCRDAPAVAVTADQHFSLAGTGFSDLWLKPLDLARVFRELDALIAAVDPASPLSDDVATHATAPDAASGGAHDERPHA
jgi:CheY-like chemotaxis protein